MKKLAVSALTAAALGLSAAGANAAMIFSTPPVSGVDNSGNDVFGAAEGWLSANLYLSSAGPTLATVTLIGWEAGASNTFDIGAPPAEFNKIGPPNKVGTLGAPVGPSISVTLNPGLIPFSFLTSVAGGGSVANGDNNHLAPRFFISLFSGPIANLDTTVNGSTPASGTRALLGLDDGGAGNDGDFDDLVVLIALERGSIHVTAPAVLGLLGLGLLGVGALRRWSV